MSKERVKPQQFCRAQLSINNAELELNSEQQKELASFYERALDQFKKGSLITGKIIKISPEGVLVDINYKSDGLIPLYEFTDYEIKRLQPGSEIEVILDELENNEGNVVLSYEKAKAMKAWDRIIKLFEEGKPVEGVITHKVKGGLSVDIGITAFLPGSQIDVQRVTDFDKLVGQTITADIIKINQRRGNVIISRRKYLNEQKSESRKKLLDVLQIGQVIQGVVKNITNYGVFVDIGGVDGLLHITDMTWGRIAHPSEMVKLGQLISAKVLSFDKVNEKISLGLKQLNENPWEKISDDLQVGSKVKGTVSSIVDYGLFLEILPGVEGLVHISEISWVDRISDLNKLFKVGQSVEALVVALDKEKRRMSLSIKQLEKNPWQAVSENYQVGQKIKGKISNITEFGLFVQLVPGVDGLVHISDLSWTEHIEHPADKYKKGEEVEAVVSAINKDTKRISLSIKHLTENPWQEIEKKHPVGSIVEGQVIKVNKFGAFVRLASGIEGLVHASDISNPEKFEQLLKSEEKEEFKVVKVNEEEHRLGLSLKSDADLILEQKEKAKKQKEEAKEKAKKETKKPEHAKSQLQLELEKLSKKNKE